MTAKELNTLFTGLFQKGAPGFISSKVKFHDPENRINLPCYPGRSKESGKEFVLWCKGGDWYCMLMSHAQTAKLFSNALLDAFERKEIRHPEVTINYKKSNFTYNLIQESHRIYSAKLANPKESLYFMLDDTKFPQTDICKALYHRDPKVHTKAVLKYSPLTLLFGGFGSHNQLTQPIKITGLVETEIFGKCMDGNNLAPRVGMGNYMPPGCIKNGVPTVWEDAEKKKGENPWSNVGYANVPKTPSQEPGSATVKDIYLDAKLVLDRLCALRLQDAEETLATKLYLTALWFRMFWLGYQSGFSKFKGRDLVAENVGFFLNCPPPYQFPELSNALDQLTPELADAFHEFTLEKMLELDLVELEPLHLFASPQIDNAYFDSQLDNGKSKKKKSKQKGTEE